MPYCLKLFVIPIMLILGWSGQDAQGAAAQIDPAATGKLERMGNYLGGLEQFSVHTQNTLEDLMSTGHRVDFDVSAQVTISRPNKIRSERKGSRVDQVFYYDGDTLTLYSPTHNLYAKGPAPGDYRGLFKYLYETIGFALPISDLLYRNSYELLMQDVQLAQVIGETYIDGVKCDHLLFSRPGVDFQVWIEQGDTPLPRKYVVTDTALPMRLSISTLLSDWNVEPGVDDSFFRFDQPEGSREIDFILN
jgi:hypothetical protein